MNSPPLSQVDAEQGHGQAAAHVEERLEGPAAGATCARCAPYVQPLATSVTHSE
jgi:hypothetical protein